MSNINAIAHQVNTVAKFEADLHNLLEVMGKADVTVMPEGATVKTYAEATPASVSYSEGSLIPDSEVTPTVASTVSLAWDPKRNLVTYQKIQTMGYDIAVGGSADKLVKMIGAGIRSRLCTAVSASGVTTTASDNSTTLQGANVQKAAALAIGRLQELCADEAGTPIFLMSPMTFAAYAGAAAITTQDAYGLQYMKGFMGVGNAIVLPGLADNYVFATTCENINLCAASVAGANGTKDAAGVISVNIIDAPEYNGVHVVATAGVSAFLNVLAKCVKVAVGQ